VHQLNTKEKLLLRENQLLQYDGQVLALLESGALPRKKDKKNPLGLTATLPLVATAASTASKERPLSATPQGSKAKRTDASQRASSSQK
jgi:hypothetical protein